MESKQGKPSCLLQTFMAFGLTVYLAVGSILLLDHCGVKTKEAEYHKYLRHPVQQVYRNWDGYRTVYKDDSGDEIENNYPNIYKSRYIELPDLIPSDVRKNFQSLDDYAEGTEIIRDLEAGVQGYADVLHFKPPFIPGGPKADPTKHAEIHLDPYQKLLQEFRSQR